MSVGRENFSPDNAIFRGDPDGYHIPFAGTRKLTQHGGKGPFDSINTVVEQG
jgi:hypothetical protein